MSHKRKKAVIEKFFNVTSKDIFQLSDYRLGRNLPWFYWHKWRKHCWWASSKNRYDIVRHLYNEMGMVVQKIHKEHELIFGNFPELLIKSTTKWNHLTTVINKRVVEKKIKQTMNLQPLGKIYLAILTPRKIYVSY